MIALRGWALTLGASSGFGEAASLALARAGLNIFGVHLDRKATLGNVERIVGDITARNPKNAFPPGVFEFGISVFEAADRGKGYGRDATELLTSHLFDEHGAGRVQATTAVDNLAMRRVLESLGFVHEGTLRAFMPGPDGREDYTMYAVTREEWTRPRSASPA